MIRPFVIQNYEVSYPNDLFVNKATQNTHTKKEAATSNLHDGPGPAYIEVTNKYGLGRCESKTELKSQRIDVPTRVTSSGLVPG